MKPIKDNSKVIKFSIVLIVLIFIFFLVYRFRLNFDYPIHVDEWQHIAQATYIIDTGHIPSFREYLERGYRGISYIEIGFFLFLSQMILLTGIDPVLQYKIFPPIFTCIAGFMAFTISYKFTKKIWIGIFTLVVFASIKSNFNILGNLFFTPLSFGFALIYLIFFTIIEGIERKSLELIIISMILSATLGVIHPPSVIMVYFVIFVYSIARIDIIKENLRIVAILGAFLFIFVTYALYDVLYLGHRITIELIPHIITEHILGKLIWPAGSYPGEAYYNLWDFYGIAPSILAIIGMLFVLKKDKRLLFAIWSMVTLDIIFIFSVYEISIITPYQKMIYYAVMSFAILSGIGLNSILELFMKVPVRNVSSVLTIIFLVIVLFYTFKDYYPQIPTGYIIEDSDYQIARWLKENYGPYHKVIAPIVTSEVIYPVSKNYVIANIFFLGNKSARNDVYGFYSRDCDAKKSITKEYGIEVILSKSSIECDNMKLTEIYHGYDFHVYKVMK